MASLQKRNSGATHLISSAEKFTMVGMKFSLMMMERICFQSVVLSPSNRQMDSSASFTAAGGLAMDRTSTRCCFFMDFTAGYMGWKRKDGGRLPIISHRWPRPGRSNNYT
uniref:Uncharacterized protein n=1 Tax=Balaenoptera musculus TaxID=9771 RepID=A0A8C0CRI7_BALMU